MTIFAAAMLLALAQAESPPPTDDVVVAAARLKRFRAVTRKDKAGVTRCVIKRRSGDPALDQGICDALLACVPTVKRESDIRPCMEPAIKALLPKAEWEAKRARR